jgi:hypothetical protein
VDLAGSPTSDLLRFAKNTIMLEEAPIDGSNIEFDSFNQMQVVLEGLFHLGTLGDTMTVRFFTVPYFLTTIPTVYSRTSEY